MCWARGARTNSVKTPKTSFRYAPWCSSNEISKGFPRSQSDSRLGKDPRRCTYHPAQRGPYSAQPPPPPPLLSSRQRLRTSLESLMRFWPKSKSTRL
jgi:hypothetical protein